MWKKTILIFGLAVLAALVVFACSGPGGTTAKKSGKAVAKVGNSSITVDDIQAILDRIPPFQRRRFASEKGKKELLDNLVNEELFYQEAIRRGLDRDDDFVQRMEQFRRGILANMVKKEIYEEEIEITDADIKKYYDDNEKKFMTPEQVSVSLILVKCKKNASDEEVAKAKARAEEALKKLNAGSAWDKIVEQYSEDRGTKKRGGLLRNVRKGLRGAEFDDVAFSMTKKGEISDIFRSRQGFNIIRFEEKKEAKKRDFESVRGSIERQIKQEKIKNRMETIIENLRKKASVQVFDDVLDSIDVGGESEQPQLPQIGIDKPQAGAEEGSE